MCNDRGRSFWLLRAVDHDGVTLTKILQSRRDKRAARRLLWDMIKADFFILTAFVFSENVSVTDKVRSYQTPAKARVSRPVWITRFAQRPQQQGQKTSTYRSQQTGEDYAGLQITWRAAAFHLRSLRNTRNCFLPFWPAAEMHRPSRYHGWSHLMLRKTGGPARIEAQG